MLDKTPSRESSWKCSLTRPRQRSEAYLGKRALRFERSVRVETGSEVRPLADTQSLSSFLSPPQGSLAVDQAVDAFFGIADTGTTGALEGFKAVVKTGLKANSRQHFRGRKLRQEVLRVRQTVCVSRHPVPIKF